MADQPVEWRPFCGDTSCPCMEPDITGACEEFVGEEAGNHNPRCGRCGWPEYRHKAKTEATE